MQLFALALLSRGIPCCIGNSFADCGEVGREQGDNVLLRRLPHVVAIRLSEESNALLRESYRWVDVGIRHFRLSDSLHIGSDEAWISSRRMTRVTASGSKDYRLQEERRQQPPVKAGGC